jgi:hypothetical protein
MNRLQPVQISVRVTFGNRVFPGEGRIPDHHVKTASAKYFRELELPVKGRNTPYSNGAHDPLNFVICLKICNVFDRPFEQCAFGEPIFVARFRFR